MAVYMHQKKLSGNIDISNITSISLGDPSNAENLNDIIYYDDVRIFDETLTPSEIRSLAHSNVSQRKHYCYPQIDPTFDLSSVFSDPNSNDTLTYSVSVAYESEPGLATVSISGSTLTVDINDATEGGNAVIEVTASDGTCSSTHTFNLIVLPDKDQDGVADEDDLDDDNDGIFRYSRRNRY